MVMANWTQSAVFRTFLFVHNLSRQRCDDRIPDRLANVPILFLVTFCTYFPTTICIYAERATVKKRPRLLAPQFEPDQIPQINQHNKTTTKHNRNQKIVSEDSKEEHDEQKIGSFSLIAYVIVS